MNQEATVVKEPTEDNLRILAVWAHDLGTFLYAEGRSSRRHDVEVLALRELETRADLAPIPANDARVRAVWCWNFRAGWHTARWQDERCEVPTVNVPSNYVPLRGEELH